MLIGISFLNVSKNPFMKSKDRHKHDRQEPRQENVEIRKDLQDASKGKDLSYLNEMPQMGRYEGVKAGVPPAKDKRKTQENDMSDES
jgi:hypothetical protein